MNMRVDQRREQIIAVLGKHGSMSADQIAEHCQINVETIRRVLARFIGNPFLQIADFVPSPGNSMPAIYGLEEDQLDDTELDRRHRRHAYAGWPKADPVVVASINAMVRVGAAS